MSAGYKTSYLSVAFLLAIAGCQNTNLADQSTFADSALSVQDVSDVAFYKNDELLQNGKVQFREKNYGKAYAVFKRSVELFPNDPQAWLGYAASADELGRFKNADLAYNKLSKMIPTRPEYFNNLGYSYLLRGDLRKARDLFLRAYEIDPANETTANNLELLRNSDKFAKRA